MTLNISGYNGQVWSSVLQTLSYFNTNISASDTSSAQTLASVSSLSLKNAVNLMDANFDINQIYTAYTILSEALAAPVSLDPTTLAYLT
ncbi:MAG: hypothetical protein KGI54_16495, partial [Pseudomonadota bacterium]|nr:hypothetical protein [Pseudomonadota bacterium]